MRMTSSVNSLIRLFENTKRAVRIADLWIQIHCAERRKYYYPPFAVSVNWTQVSLAKYLARKETKYLRTEERNHYELISRLCCNRLGCSVGGSSAEVKTAMKINKFIHRPICGIVQGTLRREAFPEIRLEFYKLMAFKQCFMVLRLGHCQMLFTKDPNS